MKLSLGQIYGIIAVTITITTNVVIYVIVNNNDKKEIVQTLKSFERRFDNNDKKIDLLSQLLNNHISQPDSAKIYSRDAWKLSKINVKCNIEMSKQLKGFDILKFYDPFMWLNRQDTALKKKNLSNPMYAGKL